MNGWAPWLFTWNDHSIVNWLCCCCCLVMQSCPTLWDPRDCSTPGLPVPHHLLKFDQVHVHCISDTIQPSHLLTPSSSALRCFQHQGLYQWVSYSHLVTKILNNWLDPNTKKKKNFKKRSTSFRTIGKGTFVCWILFIFHRTGNILVISWFSEFYIIVLDI